jgi:hypothetical protein
MFLLDWTIYHTYAIRYHYWLHLLLGWHHATIFQSQIRIIMIHLARLILTEVFSFYLFLCTPTARGCPVPGLHSLASIVLYCSLSRGLSFDLAAGRSYCEPHISRSDILMLLRTLRTTVIQRLSTLTPSLSGITIMTVTPGSGIFIWPALSFIDTIYYHT